MVAPESLALIDAAEAPGTVSRVLLENQEFSWQPLVIELRSTALRWDVVNQNLRITSTIHICQPGRWALSMSWKEAEKSFAGHVVIYRVGLRIFDSIIVVILDRTMIEVRWFAEKYHNSVLTFGRQLLAGIRNSICYIFSIH
jgi:hypothetical protein